MKPIKLKELIAETWYELKLRQYKQTIAEYMPSIKNQLNEETWKQLLLEINMSMNEDEMDKNPGFPDQDQDISGTQSMTSPGSRLMMTKGAPFGGNVAAVGNVVLSNESRVALRNWVKLAKFAWKKYGQPSRFPPEINDQLEQLGAEFEKTTGPRAPGVGYRP
jgi:hypothetical protein